MVWAPPWCTPCPAGSHRRTRRGRSVSRSFSRASTIPTCRRFGSSRATGRRRRGRVSLAQISTDAPLRSLHQLRERRRCVDRRIDQWLENDVGRGFSEVLIIQALRRISPGTTVNVLPLCTSRLGGPVDLTHAAHVEGGIDLVGAERGAGLWAMATVRAPRQNRNSRVTLTTKARLRNSEKRFGLRGSVSRFSL